MSIALENKISQLESELSQQQKMYKKQAKMIDELKKELKACTLQTNPVPHENIMNAMIMNFAHELSQPLTAIGVYSQACHLMMKNELDHKALSNKLSFPIKQMEIQSNLACKIIQNMKNHLCEKYDSLTA